MYTQARIGGNHPPETTAKFIAAKFEHDTARPVDGYVAPQLHTHAVVFNVTERDNGQSRAIQPQSLFASQQFATAVYQSELTYRLRQLGYEIAVGRSGAPEIKGYTQEYLDASSPRSQQIREYLERTGRTGKEAAEIAAHSTRDRKEIHSPADVMAAHRKLAADFGHQAEAVVRAARERLQHQEKPVNSIDRVRESLTFSRDKNFEREAVVDERALIRDGLRRGMGEVTFAQVRGNLDARLASGEFQIVERSQSHTSPSVHHCQDHRGRARDRPPRARGTATRSSLFCRASRPSLLPTSIRISTALRRVWLRMYSVPPTVFRVSRALPARAKRPRFPSFAAPPNRRATRSRASPRPPAPPASLARRALSPEPCKGSLPARPILPLTEQRHFYFVDESSLASTNQMREFLARLGPNDRVLLIGDTRQHQGVEAGRPFEQLQEAGMRTAKLDEIVRQKDPALKSAVEMLAKGQVSAALESLQQQGRVKEIPGTEERIRAIARSYVESPEKTLIVSPDNASRRELNVAVRQELKANGTLAPEDHTFRVLVQRQDMTGAERSWASHFEINDVVRYARGSKIAGIEAGTYGTVVGINPAANLLTVEKILRRTGHLRSAPPDRRQRLPRDRPRVFRWRPHPVHRARQVARRRQSRPCRHRVHRARWPHFSPSRQQPPS